MAKDAEILNHRYKILRLLSARGGMGLVYLASDLNLQENVAIKQSRFNDEAFLRQNFPDLNDAALRSHAEDMRKAFEREARLLFGLRHNALPRVLDYFDLDGQQSLVMEFIPGKDLGELLAERAQANQGPFPLDQVLGWADQLLDALNYLHTRFDTPIIHRDIKPQNLKLTPDGQIILLDFGLAKGARPGMSVVESIWGGTPEYAPLEQLDEDENQRQKSDPRSDLYSLALTLYHLLSGRKPPRTISRLTAKAQSMPDPLRPLSEIAPHIPETVSEVLQRAAAVFAEDRLATAAEMRQRLRQAAASRTQPVIVQQPEPEPQTIVRPSGKIVISLNPGNEGAKPKVETKLPSHRIVTPSNYAEDLNGVRLEMIYIPGGEFTMGSNDDSNDYYDDDYPDSYEYSDSDDDDHSNLYDYSDSYDEKPPHMVKLSPFFIGKYQITQAQWEAVMGDNPSYWNGDDLPVECVSWNHAVKFCETISNLTGKTYRLPTEAEWEYACRAGSTRKYCFGGDWRSLGDYAWYSENSDKRTHPVGQKRPNVWGLYDMHGNVWEWCQDRYYENYYEQSPRENPQGPSSGTSRLLRGGSWSVNHFGCRSARRGDFPPDSIDRDVGFRVVCVARTS